MLPEWGDWIHKEECPTQLPVNTCHVYGSRYRNCYCVNEDDQRLFAVRHFKCGLEPFKGSFYCADITERCEYYNTTKPSKSLILILTFNTCALPLLCSTFFIKCRAGIKTNNTFGLISCRARPRLIRSFCIIASSFIAIF